MKQYGDSNMTENIDVQYDISILEASHYLDCWSKESKLPRTPWKI